MKLCTWQVHRLRAENWALRWGLLSGNGERIMGWDLLKLRLWCHLTFQTQKPKKLLTIEGHKFEVSDSLWWWSILETCSWKTHTHKNMKIYWHFFVSTRDFFNVMPLLSGALSLLLQNGNTMILHDGFFPCPTHWSSIAQAKNCPP